MNNKSRPLSRIEPTGSLSLSISKNRNTNNSLKRTNNWSSYERRINYKSPKLVSANLSSVKYHPKLFSLLDINYKVTNSRGTSLPGQFKRYSDEENKRLFGFSYRTNKMYDFSMIRQMLKQNYYNEFAKNKINNSNNLEKKSSEDDNYNVKSKKDNNNKNMNEEQQIILSKNYSDFGKLSQKKKINFLNTKNIKIKPNNNNENIKIEINPNKNDNENDKNNDIEIKQSISSNDIKMKPKNNTTKNKNQFKIILHTNKKEKGKDAEKENEKEKETRSMSKSQSQSQTKIKIRKHIDRWMPKGYSSYEELVKNPSLFKQKLYEDPFISKFPALSLKEIKDKANESDIFFVKEINPRKEKVPSQKLPQYNFQNSDIFNLKNDDENLSKCSEKYLFRQKDDKERYSITRESKSNWKAKSTISTFMNCPSQEYNILNPSKKNISRTKEKIIIECGKKREALQKNATSINFFNPIYRQKGISEFIDTTRNGGNNPGVDFINTFNKNPKCFFKQNEICSDFYDSYLTYKNICNKPFALENSMKINNMSMS